jgi:hypothetical protein
MSDYRTIIQVLRDHIGARLEAPEAEGRDELQDTLREVLQLDPAEAEATLNGLIGAGQIRYVTPDATDIERSAANEIQVGSVASAPAAGSGAPLVVSGLYEQGYWLIGDETFDVAPNVRKGQVRPTGL